MNLGHFVLGYVRIRFRRAYLPACLLACLNLQDEATYLCRKRAYHTWSRSCTATTPSFPTDSLHREKAALQLTALRLTLECRH
ncbi:hypothetical protein E2C01_066223 [Portunus trituberculatus]|uniref:Uncharacterized protein n=1 Tax=Portunus trituberculatus TaxID=210409 RepID=A0A5B7HGI5_PORTR|nr:hypothetical protein [Portunus trituberculatus]